MNTLSGTERACKSAISKYGMHLQKCNLMIWIYSPCGLLRQSAMDLLSPSGPRRYFAEVSWLRGSVNSGIIYVPDLHPTPFCFFWGFFLVYFWSVCSSSSLEASLRFVAAPCMHFNACIISERGGGQDSHPP